MPLTYSPSPIVLVRRSAFEHIARKSDLRFLTGIVFLKDEDKMEACGTVGSEIVLTVHWGRREQREGSLTENRWQASGRKWPGGVVSWHTWCSCPRWWQRELSQPCWGGEQWSTLPGYEGKKRTIRRVTGRGDQGVDGIRGLHSELSPRPFRIYFVLSQCPAKFPRLSSNVGSSYISLPWVLWLQGCAATPSYKTFSRTLVYEVEGTMEDPCLFKRNFLSGQNWLKFDL